MSTMHQSRRMSNDHGDLPVGSHVLLLISRVLLLTPRLGLKVTPAKFDEILIFIAKVN